MVVIKVIKKAWFPKFNKQSTQFVMYEIPLSLGLMLISA